jgi:hypothetical protein
MPSLHRGISIWWRAWVIRRVPLRARPVRRVCYKLPLWRGLAMSSMQSRFAQLHQRLWKDISQSERDGCQTRGGRDDRADQENTCGRPRRLICKRCGVGKCHTDSQHKEGRSTRKATHEELDDEWSQDQCSYRRKHRKVCKLELRWCPRVKLSAQRRGCLTAVSRAHGFIHTDFLVNCDLIYHFNLYLQHSFLILVSLDPRWNL